MKTKTALVYNVFILICYIALFIIGIFSLRYLNIERQINLKEYYNTLIKLITEFTFHEILITIILIFLLIIIYLATIYKLTLYFKFHAIKRHVYLVGPNIGYNWYEHFHDDYLYPYNINTIHGKILALIRNYYNKYYFSKQCKPEPEDYNKLSEEEKEQFHYKSPASPFGFVKKYKLNSIVFHIITKWHHILLLGCILYDTYYNDFIITKIFALLPWIFFYELYIRISHFKDGLWLPYDSALNMIIYCSHLEIIDKNKINIDGNYYDSSFYDAMYNHYIRRGFVKDPHHLKWVNFPID